MNHKIGLLFALVALVLGSSIGMAGGEEAAAAVAGTAAAWFGLIFLVIWGIVLLGILASLIALIWGLIDILKAKNDTTWKILWVIVCLFLGIFGVIIYFFVGRKQKVA